MKTVPQIWAVVLAAGESKRMNSPKLILPYRGSTIIGHLISSIKESDVAGIMVVLGAWRKEVEDAVRNLKVDICINELYTDGMLSSVITGIKALPDDADGVMIIPGDQPEISGETINMLIAVSRNTKKGIIVSAFNGKKGHPVLILRKYFKEVEKLDNAIGLKELIIKFPHDLLETETGNRYILKDIDTPEDYLEAINNT